MRKVIGLLGALTAAGALIGLVPGGASGASTYVCTRGLMPGSYPHVHVPAGAICRSNGGVTVSGGVSIAAGATFVLGTDQGGGGSGGGLTSTIVGGVRALNAASV